MSIIMPLVSIFLALLVAAVVAYLAWEVTKEASRDTNDEHDNDKD